MKNARNNTCLVFWSFAIMAFSVHLVQANTSFKSLPNDTVYKSAQLILVKLSAHTYQHISFLKTNDFGNVSCNGMVVINDYQAIIFDTPATTASAEELINYLNKNLKTTVKAVIPTHFHQDCIAGLDAFQKRQIPIVASTKTIAFLKRAGNKFVPFIKGFKRQLNLTIGDKKVYAAFLGEGHTEDNVIGYFPAERVLFGGCLIKELGAQKGNLEDANVAAWSKTVETVSQNYPRALIIIPGHGKSGGIDLLHYTSSLFK
ncbi:metallo-beta-lactamase class B [Pedobacter sp. UYEF25]